MNRKIKLPFSEINLINCQKKQFNFLSDYFFEADFNTRLFFKINVVFKNLKKPKKYRQVEKDTLASDKHLYLRDTRKQLCKINLLVEEEINITCDYNFDLYYLFNFILEPLIIINLANSKVMLIHSSAVAENNKAILFSAWRNTGKTEAILKLSKKNNYSFISDDYTALYKNRAYSFPKKINLFSYNLNKNLLKKLQIRKMLKLKFFMLIKNILEQLSYVIPNKAMSKVFFRVSELAEVATNFKISPKKLEMNFLNSALITKINIIQKSNYKFKKIITPREASKLMTSTIDYELNDFFKSINKYLYLNSTISLNRNDFLNNYENNLTKLLEKQKIVLRSVV